MTAPIRTETQDGVRSIILNRPQEYNTITPQLRDALAQAIDEADADPEVHVMLLRADGPAFRAGYGLDWPRSTRPSPKTLTGSGIRRWTTG